MDNYFIQFRIMNSDGRGDHFGAFRLSEIAGLEDTYPNTKVLLKNGTILRVVTEYRAVLTTITKAIDEQKEKKDKQ